MHGGRNEGLGGGLDRVKRALWIAILVCAACDGGRGVRAEMVATLPLHGGYKIGFEADGDPVLGQVVGPSPLLRLEGGEWRELDTGGAFSVAAFGSDLDGTPLVVHTDRQTGVTAVLRLAPDGAATRLGDPIDEGGFEAVFEDHTGTRYVSGRLSRTWRLRPGATTWEAIPFELHNLVRASDGRSYGISLQRFVRVEGDGTATPVTACVRVTMFCSSAMFDADGEGRIYAESDTALLVFDPAVGHFETVANPRLSPANSNVFSTGLRASARYVVFAVLGPAGLELFSMPPGGRQLAPVHREEVGESAFALHVDPAGVVYASQGNRLFRLDEGEP